MTFRFWLAYLRYGVLRRISFPVWKEFIRQTESRKKATPKLYDLLYVTVDGQLLTECANVNYKPVVTKISGQTPGADSVTVELNQSMVWPNLPEISVDFRLPHPSTWAPDNGEDE